MVDAAACAGHLLRSSASGSTVSTGGRGAVPEGFLHEHRRGRQTRQRERRSGTGDDEGVELHRLAVRRPWLRVSGRLSIGQRRGGAPRNVVAPCAAPSLAMPPPSRRPRGRPPDERRYVSAPTSRREGAGETDADSSGAAFRRWCAACQGLRRSAHGGWHRRRPGCAACDPGRAPPRPRPARPGSCCARTSWLG